MTIFPEVIRNGNKILVRTLQDEQNLFIAFQVKDKNLHAEQTILEATHLTRGKTIELLTYHLIIKKQ